MTADNATSILSLMGLRSWYKRRRGEWWAERAANVVAVTQAERDRQIRLLMLAKARDEPEPLDRWGYPTLESAPTVREFMERWERIKRREHIAELEAEVGIEFEDLY